MALIYIKLEGTKLAVLLTDLTVLYCRGCCPAAAGFGPWFCEEVLGNFATDITGSSFSLLVLLFLEQILGTCDQFFGKKAESA